MDTGCDFGNPDLQHALDPGTYDGTGLGMAMSWYHANSTPVANLTKWNADPFNLLTYKDASGDVYLDVTGWDPLLNGGNYGRYLYGDGNQTTRYVNRIGFIWLYAVAWGIDVGDILDYIQEDWKLPATSEVYGNYSVGWIFQQRWSPYAKFFAPVLVFNATADKENKLILNWEDSMGWMKLWTGGFNYETYDLTNILDAYEIITTFDFDFTDEFAAGEIFDLDNPIVAHDYDGDGQVDVSFGSLCWGYDAAGWYDDEPIFNGFRSDRDMFCLYFDDGTHGTATATHIAGLGNTYYNFDNESTFQMTGIAPGADILSVKMIAHASDYFSFIWACGFDMKNTTSLEMMWTGNHQADLITNSWGWVTAPSSQFDYMSLTWDILSTPSFLNTSYSGVLHVFSAGNEGSGFMTTGPPGCSPGVLTVGASTTSHWLDYLYGPDQMDYEGIASFSSKGPSFSGYVKPDIVAPGLGGYAGVPWYGAYFNDMWLPSIWEAPGTVFYNYTMFSGTSQSAPVAAGVAALVYEALGGIVVNPAQVKNILQYTAVDLGYDPATQGFGRVDAEAACELTHGPTGVYFRSLGLD
jgi:subtilisin family serine protease